MKDSDLLSEDLEKLSVAADDTIKTVGWFDLPINARSMIIEKMDTKSKCRLSMCSKDSNYEVKSSENYIKDIEYEVYYGKSITLTIRFKPNGFIYMKFRGEEGSCKVEYSARKKWEAIENGNTEEVAFTYFMKWFEYSSKSLERLTINVGSFPFNQISIKHFNKLNTLTIYKYNKQLDIFTSGFTDFEQLCGMTNWIELRGQNISFDQLIQLKTERITIDAFDWTENDFNKFFKLWRNDELNRNLECVDFHLEEDKYLDDEKLFDGVYVYDVSHGIASHYTILHPNNPRVTGKVFIEPDDRLCFGVAHWSPWDDDSDYELLD